VYSLSRDESEVREILLRCGGFVFDRGVKKGRGREGEEKVNREDRV
jgi:hypothetical protein